LVRDRVLYPEIRKATQLVRAGSMVLAAREASSC
jgi:hypothetical protein